MKEYSDENKDSRRITLKRKNVIYLAFRIPLRAIKLMTKASGLNLLKTHKLKRGGTKRRNRIK